MSCHILTLTVGWEVAIEQSFNAFIRQGRLDLGMRAREPSWKENVVVSRGKNCSVLFAEIRAAEATTAEE